MRPIVFLLLMIWSACTVSAQQIPWAPTLKQPFEAPTTFLGVDASAGYAWHNAHLPYLDEVYSIPCCTYDRGSGIPLALAGTIETWVLPSVAVSASIGLASESVEFATDPITFPRRGKPDVQTQYVFESRQSRATFAAGAKLRVLASPLTLSIRASGNILLGSTMSHKEVVLGPTDFYFLTDPPAKEHVLPEARFTDASAMVIRPSIAISYDLPLQLGYYASPYIRLETSAGSLSRQHEWSATSISLGLVLYKGL